MGQRERDRRVAQVKRWVAEAGWSPPWTSAQFALMDRLAALIDRSTAEDERKAVLRAGWQRLPPQTRPVAPTGPTHGVAVRKRAADVG